jgi:hypothetical protein
VQYGVLSGQLFPVEHSSQRLPVTKGAIVQTCVAHSTSTLHGSPVAFGVRHAPPLQYDPTTQSAWVVHDARHVVALAQTSSLLHVSLGRSLHPPAAAVTPSQALGCRLACDHCPVSSARLVHVAPHAVPAGAGMQPPLPLHPPARQLAAEAGQAVSAAPDGAFLQVPEPSRLQRWQVGHAPVMQQTLSTQCWLPHSLLLAQTCPSERPTQV